MNIICPSIAYLSLLKKKIPKPELAQTKGKGDEHRQMTILIQPETRIERKFTSNPLEKQRWKRMSNYIYKNRNYTHTHMFAVMFATGNIVHFYQKPITFDSRTSADSFFPLLKLAIYVLLFDSKSLVYFYISRFDRRWHWRTLYELVCTCYNERCHLRPTCSRCRIHHF